MSQKWLSFSLFPLKVYFDSDQVPPNIYFDCDPVLWNVNFDCDPVQFLFSLWMSLLTIIQFCVSFPFKCLFCPWSNYRDVLNFFPVVHLRNISINPFGEWSFCRCRLIILGPCYIESPYKANLSICISIPEQPVFNCSRVTQQSLNHNTFL